MTAVSILFDIKKWILLQFITRYILLRLENFVYSEKYSGRRRIRTLLECPSNQNRSDLNFKIITLIFMLDPYLKLIYNQDIFVFKAKPNRPNGKFDNLTNVQQHNTFYELECSQKCITIKRSSFFHFQELPKSISLKKYTF
jgi:hypothetical protein